MSECCRTIPNHFGGRRKRKRTTEGTETGLLIERRTAATPIHFDFLCAPSQTCHSPTRLNMRARLCDLVVVFRIFYGSTTACTSSVRHS